MVLSLEADLGLVCFSSCCSLDLGEYVAGSSLFLYRLLRQDFDLELELMMMMMMMMPMMI